MQSLPLEILAEITSSLNIRDVSSAQKAHHDVPLNTRVNPFTYLRSTFSNPLELMTAMTDTGTVISGSRALEYFEPGSVSNDSDWDFFVHPDATAVSVMMRVLEESGVKWDIDLGPLERLMAGQRGHVEKMHINDIRRANSYAHHNARHNTTGYTNAYWKSMHNFTLRLLGVSSKVVHSARKKTVRYMRENDGGTLVKPIVAVIRKEDDTVRNHSMAISVSSEVTSHKEVDYADDERLEMFIIRGSVDARGTKENIQLVACTRMFHTTKPRPMDKISSFYATHVQCFISGWCAVQLFPELTRRKTAMIWTGIGRYNWSYAVEKYTDRGYTFTSRCHSELPDATVIRVTDEKVLSVDFQEFYKGEILTQGAEERYKTLEETFVWLRKHAAGLKWKVLCTNRLHASRDASQVRAIKRGPRLSSIYEDEVKRCAGIRATPRQDGDVLSKNLPRVDAMMAAGIINPSTYATKHAELF